MKGMYGIDVVGTAREGSPVFINVKAPGESPIKCAHLFGYLCDGLWEMFFGDHCQGDFEIGGDEMGEALHLQVPVYLRETCLA